MLHLVFRLGVARYALRSAHIVEVLPLVEWRAMPGVPASVLGVFSYHGTLVPVLDLGQLVHGKATDRQNPRIVLVNYAAGAGAPRLLGLLVESATGLLRRREQDFDASPVSSDAQYAGPVTADENGLIQRIDLEELVPDELWERLGPGSEANLS